MSLARFGFNISAKFNGLDPENSLAQAQWASHNIRKAWEHLAGAIEAEVLRRHGIMVPTELAKTRVDILKLNAEMSGR